MKHGKAGLRSLRHTLQSFGLLASALAMSACPNQELSVVRPCTVSGVSLDASGGGINKVDLLFVIDNSGSMAEEQAKLNQQLTRLVKVLTSGNRDGVVRADGKTDFPPVASLHLGVVSSDLGLNGQPVPMGVEACRATAGDEGRLLSSTAVAVAGVSSGSMVRIAPRPECAAVNVQRFLDFDATNSKAETVAQQFSCIAELGIKGCGIEQQLESMWRALAPSTNNTFSRAALGQGAPSGANAGFLRDEAVLAVVMVTDEEDCSAPDAAGSVVYNFSDSTTLNVLCTRNPDKLHGAARYIEGLKSLKPRNPDRIVFAGIVGVPTKDKTAGLTLDQILAHPDMRVAEETLDKTLVQVPACRTSNAGNASPARRIVEVAKGFGKNGVITSICEDDYAPALSAVIDKIAEQLTQKCLPRALERNGVTNKVECTVVEVKAADDKKPCAGMPGRIQELKPRYDENGLPHIVCELDQLPVVNRQTPVGNGWYYDDFSPDADKCEGDGARIAFSPTSPLSPGSVAKFECFRTVPNIENQMPKGVRAVNTHCTDEGNGAAFGDAKCTALSLPGEALLCIDGSCQLRCENDAHCQLGYLCVPQANGRGYCENPTCPVSQTR